MIRWSRPTLLLLMFGLLSLGAVLTGALVCARSGIAATSWIRDLVSWALGGLAAVVISVRPGRAALQVASWAAPLGLAATFLSPDQQGVHRWGDLGPVHVNIAMLLLPAAIVALGALAAARKRVWIAPVLSLALLLAQPDASQVSTLAVCMALIAWVAVRQPTRSGLIAASAVATLLAWLRLDPLAPVPEVEGIIDLAFAISPFMAGLALGLLAATAAVPAVFGRAGPPSVRLAAWALGLCFLSWAAMPFLGAFPMPFVGIGMSPIVGAWLGVGLLAGLIRDHASASSPSR